MNRRNFLYAASASALAQLARGADVHLPAGIPDFSNCGYMGGGVKLPDVPVRVEVSAASGDATDRIQAALDRVSGLPLDAGGLRGAVLLKKGRYEIGGVVRIAASGVVLRGEGQGEDGTVLFGTGKKQRALIVVRGENAGRSSGGRKVIDELVPVGAHSFRIASTKGLSVGQSVVVRREGNTAWIHEIAMDRIKPRPDAPGSTKQWPAFALDFERVITAIDGERITVDAPIMCAIETRWGGGALLDFDDGGRIRNVGVEQLRGVSEFDRSVTALYGAKKEKYFSDEEHAWSFVSIDNAVNAWVHKVKALQFGFACVEVRKARWVTVEDCDCREMVSVITGSRRYPYSISGQLCLVQRCIADSARHDFAVGARVCGPNVFLDSTAGTSYATSEPHHRWSVGGLYDNVHANIAFQDRQFYGTGHGWSGANYVAWNCEGELICQKPPTAQNWAFGQIGRKLPGAFAPREDGHWESYGRHVQPRSLYLAQLATRIAAKA